jgi:hypothetical protein
VWTRNRCGFQRTAHVRLPALQHNEVVNVTSATAQTVTVGLTRSAAVALLNLLRESRRLPLEAIGPHEIFDRLHAHFDRLVHDMHAHQSPSTTRDDR